MRTIGAPRCVFARSCRSSLIQSASLTTTSQVTVTGGDNSTSGLRPMLISLTGAGAPHSPCLIGSAGSRTASTPRSTLSQCAFAWVISSSDQTSGFAWDSAAASGSASGPFGSLRTSGTSGFALSGTAAAPSAGFGSAALIRWIVSLARSGWMLTRAAALRIAMTICFAPILIAPEINGIPAFAPLRTMLTNNVV